MRDPSVIEIDLGAISHNMRVLRQIVGPQCGICPVVKADAYGLGAIRVTRCLRDPHSGGGADMLAVYTCRQATELFHAAVGGPVLVMMPVREIGRTDELYRALICGQLHLSVHDAAHLADLMRLSDRFAVKVPLHLELDTGMSRGGCNLADAPEVLQQILDHKHLQLAGLYTHFASAESDEAMTDAQDDAFNRFVLDHREALPADCVIHAANTAATLRDQRFHRVMVRVGQAWAGFGPGAITTGSVINEAHALRPVVTWISSLVCVKTVERGCTVGYGATWRAPRRSVIGLIPVGYADGYPLGLSSERKPRDLAQIAVMVPTPEGTVRAYAPVVGRVNMDQITIDLTGLGEGLLDHVAAGTPVELVSADADAPNHLPKLADRAGANLYELMCRLSPRIRRVYLQSQPPVEVVTGPHAAVAG